ncbi:hypothetical protein IWQ62_004457 [Dispira parvispora]|uniref:Uncharacterized protein n=1 Tax=Dispira parvispora TaxID=1520584 RepID=A0A9W8E5L2_9FUNG|nr:hypothetical protein IWQ62_004457 [Dispira parvispora]
MSNSTNTFTTQRQYQALNKVEKQRANEVGRDMARHIIPNQSDLIEKVTGVSSVGGYYCISQDFEALGHFRNPDPSPLHQQLYRKAREWFNPTGRSEGGRREARMYPQFKAFVFLIALLLQDKRHKKKHRLERYLLPHRMSDICGDPYSAKRHDIAISWHHPDTDIEAECRAFLDYEESKSNQKQKKSSANLGPDADYVPPRTSKKRASKGKSPEEPSSDTDFDIT